MTTLAKRGLTVLVWQLVSFPISLSSVVSGAPVQQGSLLLKAATKDWAQGKDAWQVVRDADRQLWEEENSCDARALGGSAPLTVLFGLSTFWDHVQDQRQTTGSNQKPLEIHVLGAAYPFEGRSDWSLLSSRRPPGIPAVRIVLVLGTPWHADNVPEPEGNPEAGTAMLQLGIHPVAGKWSNREEMLKCKNDAELEQLDKSWKKADFCRDHGNGLEVVCIEKYYQDASAELPKPDVAVMFSPGFPQLARRSWDQVLRGLLDDNVVVMVGDLLNRQSPIPDVFHHRRAGTPWTVEPHSDEDGMTLIGMQAYGARRLGTRLSPFPLLIRHGDTAIAKNSVLQVFRGRVAGASLADQAMPSASVLADDAEFVRTTNWKKLFKHVGDPAMGKEYRASLLVPTSKAYEMAMRNYYMPELRKRAQNLHHKLSSKQRAQLTKLGVLGTSGSDARQRWGPRAWVYLTRTLDATEIF